MGASLSKEADAIEAGDRQKAEQIANTISSMPKPYVPDSYKPTQSESALVKAFNTVIGGVIAALGGVLGGLAISGLLKSLGLSSIFSFRQRFKPREGSWIVGFKRRKQ